MNVLGPGARIVAFDHGFAAIFLKFQGSAGKLRIRLSRLLFEKESSGRYTKFFRRLFSVDKSGGAEVNQVFRRLQQLRKPRDGLSCGQILRELGCKQRAPVFLKPKTA